MKLFTVGGKKSTPEEVTPEKVEAGLEVRFPAKAGTHRLELIF